MASFEIQVKEKKLKNSTFSDKYVYDLIFTTFGNLDSKNCIYLNIHTQDNGRSLDTQIVQHTHAQNVKLPQTSQKNNIGR